MKKDEAKISHEKASKIIKKAWSDETFKKQLLANPKKVIGAETGYEIPEGVTAKVLEETAKKFFLVLPPKPSKMPDPKKMEALEKMKSSKKLGRSHYMALLVSKTWQDETFKKQLLADPRKAIQKEFGAEIPKDLTIQVKESDPKTFYFVLPSKPSDEISDSELESVVGGQSDFDYWMNFIFLEIPQAALNTFVSGKWG